MLKQTLIATLLLAACGGAFAQSAAAPAAKAQAAPAQTLTPAQKAQLDKQNAQMAQYSLQIAQMVDRGQAGAVWDQMSSVAKQVTPRAEFVTRITADRGQLGALSERKLAAITRTQSKGGQLPAGLYININYASQFAKTPKPIRELMSYHLDSDNVWRLAGYTVR